MLKFELTDATCLEACVARPKNHLRPVQTVRARASSSSWAPMAAAPWRVGGICVGVFEEQTAGLLGALPERLTSGFRNKPTERICFHRPVVVKLPLWFLFLASVWEGGVGGHGVIAGSRGQPVPTLKAVANPELPMPSILFVCVCVCGLCECSQSVELGYLRVHCCYQIVLVFFGIILFQANVPTHSWTLKAPQHQV